MCRVQQHVLRSQSLHVPLLVLPSPLPMTSHAAHLHVFA